MDSLDDRPKESLKYAVYYQQLSSIRTKPLEPRKGKLINSKLPIIVRNSSKWYKPLPHICKFNEKEDESGDVLPGTSQIANVPVKLKTDSLNTPEKLRTSLIPIRTKYTREGTKVFDLPKKGLFMPEGKNIHRVQMLLSPDLYPEGHTQTTTVASTRPIPNLRPLYRGTNMIDSERLDDWLTTNTPINSEESNSSGTQCDVVNRIEERSASLIPEPSTSQQREERSVLEDGKEKSLAGYKTTNDNIRIWLSSELGGTKYPTKDNESGYQSASPDSEPKTKSRLSNKLMPVDDKEENKDDKTIVSESQETITLEHTSESNTSTGTSTKLHRQPTVVLISVNDNIKTIETVDDYTNVSDSIVPEAVKTSTQVSIETSDDSREYNDSISTTQCYIMENEPRIPVASYTECASEVLQKTTNFDSVEGYDFTKQVSSTAGTDNDGKDYLSCDADCTIEPLDEYAFEGETSRWYRHHDSKETNVKSDMVGTESWSYHDESDESDISCLDSEQQYYWKHELAKHFLDNGRHGDHWRCKKCNKFKRCPSSRYNFPGKFEILCKRISLRSICRRRWDRVWKKTTERWATWSLAPPARLRRFRRQYMSFNHSTIWEDAIAQTILPLYTEIGTDGDVKQQKSAALSAMFHTACLQSFCNQADLASQSRSSKFKTVNLGPTMFPFLHDKIRHSLPLPIQMLPKPVGHLYSFQETTKIKNNNTINNNTVNLLYNIEKSGYITTGCQYEDAACESVETTTSLITGVLKPHQVTDQMTGIISTMNITISSQPRGSVEVVRGNIYLRTSSVYLDMDGVPCTISEKLTSAVRFSPLELPRKPSKCVFTQNLLACVNAETEIKFSNSSRKMSASTLTSGYDFDFKKPYVLASDQTAASISLGKDNYVPAIFPTTLNTSQGISDYGMNTESSTQISPKISLHKISACVATSQRLYGDKATCYSSEVKTKALPDLSSHNELEAKKSNPPFDGKISTFVSGISMVNSNKKSGSFNVQTSHPLRLGLTGTKIVSISSDTLAAKNISRSDRNVMCNYEVRTATECEGNNSTLTCSGCLTPWRCSCGPCEVDTVDKNSKTDSMCTKGTSAVNMDTVPPRVMIAKCVGPMSDEHISRFNMEETQCLQSMLNNLIKKALAEGVPESQQSIKTCMNTSTSTHVELDTKSIGPSDSLDTISCSNYNRIETSAQCHVCNSDKSSIQPEAAVVARSQFISTIFLNQLLSEITTQTEQINDIEESPPVQCKCVAVMTSQDCPMRVLQVPTNTVSTHDSRKGFTPCTCSYTFCDIETNTDPDYPRHAEENTQTPETIVQRYHRTIDASCCTAVPHSRSLTSPQLQHNLNRQIISISRLIGKKKTSLLDPSMMEPPSLTCATLSSNLDADKWIDRCNSMEKVYQYVIGHDSTGSGKCISSSKSQLGPPTLILSKDSLADVLPIKNNHDFIKKKYDSKEIAKKDTQRIVVDNITSGDETKVSKDVKESILQACPDISETGTETEMGIYQRKSVSVVTSRCILPSAIHCNRCSRKSTRFSDECLLVYGAPRCVVHKSSVDAGVQIDTPNRYMKCLLVYGAPRCVVHKSSVDAGVQIDTPNRYMKYNSRQMDSVNQSFGMLTSYLAIPEPCQQRNFKPMVGEVLSPKVYKALYETTKLVVNEDSNLPPVRDTTPTISQVDAEVEALSYQLPIGNGRSTSIVTSTSIGPKYSTYISQRYNNEKTHEDSSCNKCMLYLAKTETGPTSSSNKGTKLIGTPPGEHEDTAFEGSLEECMKTHLVASCRYYSNMLTKQLDHVKENLTDNLPPSIEYEERCNHLSPHPKTRPTSPCRYLYTKPSSRDELELQAKKNSFCISCTKVEKSLAKTLSVCILSPAVSLTDICRHDKDHLQSVYVMLSSIEGRSRRLKMNFSE